jgi:hypothetical protein
MDVDGEVDVWYQVEGRRPMLLRFSGKFVSEMLKKIKEEEVLPDAASTLQPFVKPPGSDEEKIFLDPEDEGVADFSKLIKKHAISRQNPILIRLPGTLLRSSISFLDRSTFTTATLRFPTTNLVVISYCLLTINSDFY